QYERAADLQLRRARLWVVPRPGSQLRAEPLLRLSPVLRLWPLAAARIGANAQRSAACPRLLDFRIQLGAAEDDERRHIEPHQQDDDRADRAIRLVVRAESRDVERETGRADQPQQCCRDRASAEAMPARLSPGRRI